MLALAIGCTGKVLTVGSGANTSPDTGNNGSPSDAGSKSSSNGSPGDAGSNGSSNGSPGSSNPSGPGWAGYLENFALPSGSDVVGMTFQVASDETVTGTVRFGTLPLLSPPTDPNIGYPPPLGDGGFQWGQPDNLEHFDFTMIGGRLSGTRLTFTLDSQEIFSQWCAIQTTIYPFYNGGLPDGGITGYQCLPNSGTGCPPNWTVPGCCYTPPTASAPITVDCGKLNLCIGPSALHPCTCTATACSVVMRTTGDISFDMQVTKSPNAIDGTVVGLDAPGTPSNTAVPVHFTAGN